MTATRKRVVGLILTSLLWGIFTNVLADVAEPMVRAHARVLARVISLFTGVPCVVDGTSLYVPGFARRTLLHDVGVFWWGVAFAFCVTMPWRRRTRILAFVVTAVAIWSFQLTYLTVLLVAGSTGHAATQTLVHISFGLAWLCGTIVLINAWIGQVDLAEPVVVNGQGPS